jgi:DNA-binding SARP family transcriptional activator
MPAAARAAGLLETRGVVEFRILGPLEAVADGRSLPLGGTKQRAVLALLLLDAGRVVSTDRLIDALWTGDPPPTAIASLHNLVSQLRKALGQETIETRPPGYLIRVEAGRLDLARVRRLVDEARASEPLLRARLLGEAVAIWRGEPLAELAYEPFAQPEIARLSELRLALLEERAEAELALGRHVEVLADLEALVREHPLRERLRGQLMLALYRSGRQADALEVYRAGRKALVESLGIEPSPFLQRLHASILRHETPPRGKGTMPARDHFDEVAAELLAGRVTIVVGHHAEPLATELARRFGLPDERPELARISQAIATLNGSGPLYDTLHALVEADVEPAPLHRFLAALPGLLRERGAGHPLLVTTGYELVLERALDDAGETFDSVCYIAAGRHRGRFCHISPDGAVTLIERPNRYAAELSPGLRTVVLHLQGRVDPSPDRAWESFAVTEDDFIHYGDVADRLPVALAARMRRTHLLLLGYTLSEWTLRVVLERLWGEEPLAYRSWSVHSGPEPLEREFWRRRDVEVIDMAPAVYIAELERAVSGRRA